MQQAVCVRRKTNEQKTRSPVALKTHPEIHSSPATVTNSRRCATKHVPRVSPYSLTSIDPEFVEIGLEQLSQSVTTTSKYEGYTYTVHRKTDRQTDYLNTATLYAPRYEEVVLSYIQNNYW